MEVLSLSSSGVGTTSGSQSGSAGSAALTPTGEASLISSGRHQSPGPRSLIMPGMHVVCIEGYTPSSHDDRSLSILQGDIIEGTKTGKMVIVSCIRQQNHCPNFQGKIKTPIFFSL